ncbi:unnamed protein product [Pylaiella littoralis]
MDEDKQLAARLERLHGFSDATTKQGNSSSTNTTTLQGRLDALSGGRNRAEGVEEGFNDRLVSLLRPADGGSTSSSAEDLSTRLSRLSTGTSFVGVSSATPVKQAPHQAYIVPEDFSDEWQDLDDLLEAAVDGVGNSASNLAFNGGASVGGEPKVEAKLSEIDALLKTEAATGALGGSSSTTEGSAASRAEEAGVKINKATEAFLGTACGEWQEGKHPLRREELGQEEERLLQMASDVTDQVRLEGHEVTERVSTPVQEPPGEMRLPLAPTGRPTVSGGSGGGMTRHHPKGDADLDPREAARLIAQQAMDEARLDLGGPGGGKTPSLSGKGGKRHQQQQQSREEQASSSWCCICSENAALRCGQCEAENGHDEPELFCARCFKEVHRGDPEMEAHRPRVMSTGGAAGGQEEGRKKGFRGWRRRK